jgi:hypothetical protein
VKDGRLMETNFNQLLYINPQNKRFAIYEGPNRREYDNLINREDDRIFYIQLNSGNKYAYFTEDIGWAIYYLIKNKQDKNAKFREAKKILDKITEALNPDPIPRSIIPVCKYTNCEPCPLFEKGHCKTGGAWIQNILDNTDAK